MKIHQLFPFSLLFVYTLTQNNHKRQAKQFIISGRQAGKFNRKSFITYRLSEFQVPFLDERAVK